MQTGAGIDSDDLSPSSILGKVQYIYADKMGFTIHTDRGDVYTWSGHNEAMTPAIEKLYPAKSAVTISE